MWGSEEGEKSKSDYREEKQIDTSPATLNLPEMFGDCAKMRRLNGGPCNVVGCKWHVFTMLPVAILRKIDLGEFDDDELLDELFEKETCVLAACDRGLDTLEEIGRMMWMSRERVRQIENKATRRVKHKTRRDKLVEFHQ